MKIPIIEKHSNMKLVVVILFTCLSGVAFSQKKKQAIDTTALVREFLMICNQYKKLPLHLSLQHSSSATLAVKPQDTAIIQADFYMTEQGAYIKYGSMEQIVNDSLMLMISKDQQVMMLYPNTKNVSSQMNSYMGFQLGDSSVVKMANRYASISLPGDNEHQGIIELKNRLPLPGTDIAKEVITVKYNLQSKEPEQIVYLKRTLVPVDKTEWDSLSLQKNPRYQLVAVKENYFLVNERKGTFDYKKINHGDGVKLPVEINDRIARNQQGKLIGVKGFENYYLNMD